MALSQQALHLPTSRKFEYFPGIWVPKMSLSKQENPADRLSALDFLGGHLKIGVTKPRPQVRFERAKEKFEANVKGFFKSHIGKSAKAATTPAAITESGSEQQFPWLNLPTELRQHIVRKMPLQSRMRLAATSKGERELVKSTKVECQLFVIDDLDRRNCNVAKYPDLHWMVFTRPGKKYFLNFICDWQQDIAICFCEERRPFQGIHRATKVYWLTPSGRVKKTVIPDISSYDAAVQTATHFFSCVTEDCKRSSICMPGWPKEIFGIPEIRNSYSIGSSYDDIESIHKTYDFFEPFSFNVNMRYTAMKYEWPFSFLEVARHGLGALAKQKACDRALCDDMLDKDLRVMVLHESFVSQEKMREFVEKWTEGLIPDKFCWWAISTHMPFDEESFIYGMNFEFVEEKFGPKISKKVEKPGKKPKSKSNLPDVKMTTYSLESGVDASKKATLIIRDKMVLFANAGATPDIDETGLITYTTRSGDTETQF